MVAPRVLRNRLVEPALTVGTAIAAEPVNILSGLLQLDDTGVVKGNRLLELFGLEPYEGEATPSQGLRRMEEVGERLTYSPRTPEGQAGLQSLKDAMVNVMDTLGVDEAINYFNTNVVPNLNRAFGEEATKEIGSAILMSAPFVRKVPDLPMDEASRMQRAQDMGFDVDQPVYHGSQEKDFEFFDDKRIGERDEGFFGKGHYFADSKGEANYYGPFVGEYVVSGNLLNLDTPEGMSIVDRNYERKRFIHQMEKLDEIDALDEPQKKGLKAVKDLEDFVDNNVIVSKGQNDDGSTGFFARIKKPFLTKYDDGTTYQDYVNAPPFGQRGNPFHLDKQDAIEHLKEKIINDIESNRDQIFRQQFPGIENAIFSLSDYIRFGGVGAEELSKKAKAAGYDGIKVYDETVIFDPKNIRKKEAEFNPEKKDSSDLLSSVLNDQQFINTA